MSLALYETALRRQIPAEIFKIREIIRASHLNDTTTQLIDRWQQIFFHDFRLSPDVQTLLRYHIASLRLILRDPLSGAPLGPNPLLGTDGHTYGSGISVYILAAPADRRHLSPLEPDLEVEFELSPHPVAGYLVRWLERQGVSLYSASEERARRALLLDYQKASREAEKPAAERMAQLLQERDARNAQVDAARKTCSAAFSTLFAQKMAQNRQKIQQMVAPLRAVEQRNQERLAVVESIHQRDQAAFGDLGQRLQKTAEEEQEELKRLAQENTQNHDRFEQEMAAVLGAIEAVAGNDASTRQIIQEKIQGLIQEGFSPIAEQIAFDRRRASEQLQRIDAAHQESLAPFRASIEKTREQIVKLEKKKTKLEAIQTQTAHSLSQLEQMNTLLQKEIVETRIAIQKVREKEQVQWYATAVKIGACALINWAMPVDGVFFPDGQGFVFRTIINF